MDGAATAATAPIITQHTRSVWSEVIRQIPSDDPNKAGQLTFEDPDLADTRMLRALRAEGMREDGGLSDIIYVLNFVGRVTSQPETILCFTQINICSRALLTSSPCSTSTKETQLCSTREGMDEAQTP